MVLRVLTLKLIEHNMEMSNDKGMSCINVCVMFKYSEIRFCDNMQEGLEQGNISLQCVVYILYHVH